MSNGSTGKRAIVGVGQLTLVSAAVFVGLAIHLLFPRTADAGGAGEDYQGDSPRP